MPIVPLWTGPENQLRVSYKYVYACAMQVNPEADWAPTTAEEHVMHAFMRIGRRLKAKTHHDSIDHSVLAALHALRCSGGGVRLSELASLIALDASTASRLVRTLETDGLVVRTPDPADRRASRLELTDAGRARLEEFVERRHQLFTAAMNGWKQAEIDTFAALMTKFADGVTNAADDIVHSTKTESR
jgi:DNA-binding MarR family transcriptional regulator